MVRFVGRESELDTLERIYASSNNRCCAIYGRRRVGKTALVNEFAKDKRSIRFLATDASEKDNLDLFLAELSDFGIDISGISDFHGFFKALEGICAQRSVLIFDEFPYLIASAPRIEAMMQRFIDETMSSTDSFLILLGSSIGAMKECVLSDDKPLFGRFGSAIELMPMSVNEARLLMPRMSDVDFLSLYCILGGIPAYYLALTGGSFKECLAKDLFNPNSMFGREAESMILRELAPYGGYVKVLRAIASGRTDEKRIVERTGLSQPSCSRYLENLVFMGLVVADTPMYNTNRRTVVYRIADRFLDWHYAVMERNMSRIESLGPEKAVEALDEEISGFMGRGFEAICADYVRRTFVCREVGRWWGSVGDGTADIDVVASIDDGGANKVLMAECKFRRKRTNYDALELLMERSRFVSTHESRVFMIASLSGFSESLIEAGADGKVQLVGPKELLAASIKRSAE